MTNREVSFSVRAIDKATAVINKVTRSLEKSTAPLRKLDRSYDTAERSARRYTKTLDRLDDKFKDIGKSATIGLTLPIAALGAVTIKTAAEFEQSMKKVEVLTGGEMFEELKAQAREFGATTQHSATDAADAMVFFSMAGFRAMETYKALPSTLNLATAATTDLATAADVVTSVLRGYNLPVSDIQAMTDMMTGAFASAKMDLSTLGEALTKAGPLMSQIGVDFSETLAIIGKLRDAGIDASSVGTAIAGGAARLIKPVKEVSDRIRKLLKIDASELVDSDGNLGSFIGLIERLEDAGAGSDDFLAIFGQEAGRYLLNLRGMSGSVRELQRTIESSTGKTDEFVKAFQSGATGAMYAFRSAVEAVQISIGESGLLDTFTAVTQKFTSYIQRLSEANPAMLRLGTIALGLAATFGPLLLVLSGAIATVASAIVNFKLLSVVLALMGTTVGAALAAIAVKVALIAATVGAVVYGGWLLWENWEKITGKISASIDYLTRKFKGLVNWFIELRGDKMFGLSKFIFESEEEGYPSSENALTRRKLDLGAGPLRDLPSFDRQLGFQAANASGGDGLNLLPGWIESLASTVSSAFSGPIFNIDESKLIDEEKLGTGIASVPNPALAKTFSPVVQADGATAPALKLFNPSSFGNFEQKLPENVIPLVRPNIRKESLDSKFGEPSTQSSNKEKVSIDVNFSNIPRGTSIKAKSTTTPINLDLGWALEGFG